MADPEEEEEEEEQGSFVFTGRAGAAVLNENTKRHPQPQGADLRNNSGDSSHLQGGSVTCGSPGSPRVTQSRGKEPERNRTREEQNPERRGSKPREQQNQRGAEPREEQNQRGTEPREEQNQRGTEPREERIKT
ncbi:hypothetical protein TURU_092299 [Turdus rufiventris]|nr:hypothetical protein TURU_092299 [Turdus rufiventris]